MAEEDQDSGEKTEEPTHKRLEEAFKRGQVITSREVASFLILVTLALNIVWLAPVAMRRTTEMTAAFIRAPHDLVTHGEGAFALIRDTLSGVGVILLLPLLLTLFVALLSGFIQHGMVFSADPILPKLEKISPLSGLRRLFSLRSIMEFVKGVVKITLFGVAAYLAVQADLWKMENLVMLDMAGVLRVLSGMAFKIALAACIVMAVIALLDYLYQRYEYLKSLRMTRRELKDEYKQSEGDPHIKARLKQIRMERARQRMMAAVPKADVVIRNPEHFAVALRYDGKTMRAPVVVAKGQDFTALAIIKVAEEHKVPTVRNPPLAQALYRSCDLEQEIPLEHYQAVAEVIGYVYRLKGNARAAA